MRDAKEAEKPGEPNRILDGPDRRRRTAEHAKPGRDGCNQGGARLEATTQDDTDGVPSLARKVVENTQKSGPFEGRAELAAHPAVPGRETAGVRIAKQIGHKGPQAGTPRGRRQGASRLRCNQDRVPLIRQS